MMQSEKNEAFIIDTAISEVESDAGSKSKLDDGLVAELASFATLGISAENTIDFEIKELDLKKFDENIEDIIRDKSIEKKVNKFVDKLIHALDMQATDIPRRYDGAIHPFFVSHIWFFLALFSVIVNILMLGVIYWQHLRIDYIISKVLGE